MTAKIEAGRNTRMHGLMARGLALLAVGVMLSACTGPTKKGKEARDRALQHFNIVRSRIDFDQAMQAFTRGEMLEAQRHLEVAMDKSPSEASYFVLLGRICLETSQIEPAVIAFEKAVELDTELPDPRYYLGIISERLEQPDRAAMRYLEAYERDPETPQYLTAAAEVLVGEGRLAEAEEILDRDSDRHRNNAAIHHLGGKVALLRGEWSEAVNCLKRAVLLDEEDRWMIEDLARAQLAAGHHADCLVSIGQLEELLEEHDDGLEINRMRARCYADARRWREAHKVLYELTTDHPEDIDAWIDLGLVCREIGDQRRLQKAAKRVIALDPRRFEGFFLSGCAAAEADEFEIAARCFKRATELEPKRPESWIALGMMYERSGRLTEAFAAYSKAESGQGRALMSHVSAEMD